MIKVLGIDPGPNPGVVELYIKDGKCVARTLRGLPATYTPYDLVVLERFVIGSGTVRKTREGTSATLDMIGAVQDACKRASVPVVTQAAVQVKPWATDARVKSYVGIKVRGDHHRDAARHALYAAVRRGWLPKRAQSRREYQ